MPISGAECNAGGFAHRKKRPFIGLTVAMPGIRGHSRLCQERGIARVRNQAFHTGIFPNRTDGYHRGAVRYSHGGPAVFQ